MNDNDGCLAAIAKLVIALFLSWLITAIISWIACSLFGVPCNAGTVTKVWVIYLLIKFCL